MEINKILKITKLYDFYSELLKEKQKKYIESYFFNDLSLTEISENFNISKQAVSNNIKRSILELENYEKKLSLIEQSDKRNKLYKKIENINNDEKISIMIEELIKLEN